MSYFLAWFGIGLCVALFVGIALLPERRLRTSTLLVTTALWPVAVAYIACCFFLYPKSRPDEK